MIKFLAILLILFPGIVLAGHECKEVDKGYAFFRFNDWDQTITMKILECEDGFKLAVLDTKTSKELDRSTISKPTKNQKWAFDGLGCNEGDRDDLISRQKVILGPRTTDREALKPIEAWAVNPKTKHLERIRLKTISCSKDKP
jgi:hypothetical protein